MTRVSRQKRKRHKERESRRARAQAWVVYADWETETINIVTQEPGKARQRRWLASTDISDMDSGHVPMPDLNGWVDRRRKYVFWATGVNAAHTFGNKEDAIAMRLRCQDDPEVTYGILRLR